MLDEVKEHEIEFSSLNMDEDEPEEEFDQAALYREVARRRRALFEPQRDEEEFVGEFNQVSRNKKIADDNLKMLDDPRFSDYSFIVQGEEFKVHRYFLDPVSPVFRKLFESDIEEAQTKQSIVDAISPKVFRLMLRFIYGAEIPTTLTQDALKLYEAANFYELHDLMDICKKHIKNKIKEFDALTLYEWIWSNNLEELKNAAWKIVKR
jgi:hypothetical protein